MQSRGDTYLHITRGTHTLVDSGLTGYSSRFSQACCFFAFSNLDFSLFLVVLSIRCNEGDLAFGVSEQTSKLEMTYFLPETHRQRLLLIVTPARESRH